MKNKGTPESQTLKKTKKQKIFCIVIEKRNNAKRF
jgi:hypothetical protein